MKGMIPNIQKLVKIKFIQSSISYFQQSKFSYRFFIIKEATMNTK